MHSAETIRPVYFMTLTIFALACLGTALCPTSDYWLLMLMRIAQVSLKLMHNHTSDIRHPEDLQRSQSEQV